MDAMRCLECGDVRWSLIGFAEDTGTCELCGGETVPERRQPAGMSRGGVERRDALVLAGVDTHETSGATA